MTINTALMIALLTSLSGNLIGFYYLRDLLGRLGWLTQNLANLSELVRGFQGHIRGVYELEKFYGDNDIKRLVSHTNDLIEVLDDYLDVGLDSELIEEEELGDLTNKDNLNDTAQEKKESQKNVFYSDS
jgi:hypothetical protein